VVRQEVDAGFTALTESRAPSRAAGHTAPAGAGQRDPVQGQGDWAVAIVSGYVLVRECEGPGEPRWQPDRALDRGDDAASWVVAGTDRQTSYMAAVCRRSRSNCTRISRPRGCAPQEKILRLAGTTDAAANRHYASSPIVKDVPGPCVWPKWATLAVR
jgi:hypothetical protein